MYVQTCQGSEHRSVIPHVLPQTWAQWSGPVVIENTNTIQNMKYRIQNVRGLLEKYPTFGREKETGLPGALDT